MVGQSSDGMSNGMVYGLGWSDELGLPQDEGAWMGGNVLFGFQQSNPSTSESPGRAEVGCGSPEKIGRNVSDTRRPRGVLVGIDPGRGTVGHYTKDGLLIGSMKTATAFNDPSRTPEWVVGGLDAFWLSIATVPRMAGSTFLWRIISTSGWFGIAWTIPKSNRKHEFREQSGWFGNRA